MNFARHCRNNSGNELSYTLRGGQVGNSGEEFVELAVNVKCSSDIREILELNLSLSNPCWNINLLEHISGSVK